jgi:DNA polymerase-3 subunit gamma/tau
MRSIAVAEGVKIEAAALGVIAKAAEGSDRDALSLLDQAIAHSHGGDISEDQVREMLGLADRTRILDLMDHVFSGDIKSALDELRDQYESGADPVIVLQDLLDLTHVITRLKITSETDSDPSANEQQIKRAREMADRLPMSVLSRNWSMLLKGLSETRNAPQPIAAAEMVLVRLAYVADLPTPDEAIRKIVQGAGAASASGAGASAPAKAAPAKVTTQAVAHAGARDDNNRNRPSAQVAQQMPVAKPQVVSDAAPSIHLSSLQEIIDLASERRDIALKTQLEDFVHLVAFEPGKIEFRPAEQAPSDLAGRLAERLANWTQERWVVTVTMAGGAPTVSEARRAREKQEKDDVARDPLVASVLDIFPGAKIVRIRDIAAEAGADIIAAPDDEDLSE